MRTLIADCETDGFLDSMTRLWCVQLGEEDSAEVDIYADQQGFRPIHQAIERINKAERVAFHHGLGFDMDAINRFYPGAVRQERLFDTLVAARLKFPEERNHTLKAHGLRMGEHKGEYKGDFQTFDEDLVTYALQDVVVGRKLFHLVKEVDNWGESYRLEHDVARAILLQERNGFAFNVPAAQTLDATLRGELAEAEAALQKTFPPIPYVYTPKASNSKFGYVKGTPIHRQKVFNPSSRAEVADRLVALGWKPKDYGANGVATVDEKILAQLPFPEAKVILRYFRLLKMVGQLADGKQGWLKAVGKDGRIHGRVNPNGACTGRMAHFSPNVAQADKDPRMRSLWVPRKGWVLVGCDAEGLEARMLGHYLAAFDGGAFSDRVVNGTKDDRSDVHSANLIGLVNARILPPMALEAGFKTGRDGAKTALYALMYGAGDWKLGEGVKQVVRDLGVSPPKVPSKELGALTRNALARSMKGIDKLTDRVRAAAKSRGYLIGLDGRHIPVRSEHSALNTLLQGGGAIVMKKALQLFMERHGDTHGTSWGLCANVHDEVQMEAHPDIAETLGADFADCIKQAGEVLKVRCPLAGDYSVGNNWSETH